MTSLRHWLSVPRDQAKRLCATCYALAHPDIFLGTVHFCSTWATDSDSPVPADWFRDPELRDSHHAA